MTETDYAEAWRPNPGDEIEGRVVQVDARESEYGVYPILTLEDEGGTQAAVHCVHSILRREIARRYEPTQIVGQPMRIRYEGKQTTKDGKRDFYSYRVFGGNRQSRYDWSQDLPEDERSSSAPPIAPSEPFALVSPPAASSAAATVEDFSPVPKAPTTEERAAENFDNDPPF